MVTVDGCCRTSSFLFKNFLIKLETLFFILVRYVCYKMSLVYDSLVPTFASLVVASLVVLISDVFTTPNRRVVFQIICFGGAAAYSFHMIASNPTAGLINAWKAFSLLPFETRFFLSLLTVAAVFFCGGMFVASPVIIKEAININNPTDVYKTPACVDNDVGIDVPVNLPKDDTEMFVFMLDKLQKEIVSDLPVTYELMDEAVAWVDRMITYNVKGGKMNRGLTVVANHKTLIGAMFGRTVSSKERCQAAALGWCLEFLQAFFLVADDIMDGSETRRSQPCWYKLDDVKMIAINDSFILETCVYKILKKYFGNEKYYYQLVDLFVETTRQTEFGQLLDLTSQPLKGDIDLNRFTMQRYTSIVRYKTAFYSFYLPVAAAMIMAGITSKELFQQAREILLIMGEYFQVQDDYLDCYGSPEVIGKIGTDIQDNKCSWLVVTALNKATPSQRKVLEENYGIKNKLKEKKIKKLYEEMDIEADFKAYEDASYAKIQHLLSKFNGMPKDVFEFLLNKIYKRAK